MLHGAPGLGKTTLAHVIAVHAGYNVVEMNASDDRSLAAFKTKVEAATQNKSVIGADQRPNCLIIDEIDGAPAATVNYLVNLIQGKRKGHVLQRPVLCICNDLYAPSLRPLRQQALVVPFPPTLRRRLCERLLDISRRERLMTDSSALTALCAKTEDDIRSCLSTLQFFKSRGKELRLSDVNSASVGQKDSQKSLFAVWKEIFEIPRNRNGNPDKIRFSSVLRTVQSCGEYEKVMNGVFENYLAVKFKDDCQLSNVTGGHEWLTFFDLTQHHIQRSQQYAMMAYMPYAFVSAHLRFGAFSRSKLSYPSTHADRNQSLTRTQQLISAMISEMPPRNRQFVSASNLTFDILPNLLEIIQPNLRPVNTHLYSPREKAELKHVVDTMTAYNLSYQQERTPDGQYAYALCPGVDAVVQFPEAKHRRSLSYALKQVIAREIEMEKLRKENPNPAQRGKEPAAAKKTTQNHLKKLEAKKVDAAKMTEKRPVDFFGRALDQDALRRKEEALNVEMAANKTLVSSDIWFKFKEGYNNAVRKNIRMRDLL